MAIDPYKYNRSGTITEDRAPTLKRINVRGAGAFGIEFQTAVSPTFDAQSWHIARLAEGKYNAVRFPLYNFESTTVDVGGAFLAPSTSITSTTPTGTSVPVTWDGASTVTLAARIASGRPSVVWSDWISIEGLPLSSNGNLYPCHLRVYVAAGPLSVSGSHMVVTDFAPATANSVVDGRYILCYRKTGDFVTSNESGFTTPTATNLSPVLEMEYLHNAPVLTVMGIGDSIMWGSGDTVVGASYAFHAINSASSPDMPIYWENYAVPSTTTSQFLTRLQDAIAAGRRPDVLAYSPFSPNDGTPSAAIIQAQKFRLAQVLDICRTYNIIPLLVTGICNTAAAWNAAADNFRKDFNAYLMSMAGNGIFVADINRPVSNGDTPARFNTTLSTDGTHQNNAGNAVMTAPFLASINDIKSSLRIG